MIISIFDLVGKNAVSYSQGSSLHDKLKDIWSEKKIILDFKGVCVISSPFFNGSIGLFMKDFSRAEVQDKIEYENISVDALNTLNIVLDNAESFYKRKSK